MQCLYGFSKDNFIDGRQILVISGNSLISLINYCNVWVHFGFKHQEKLKSTLVVWYLRDGV